MKELSIFVDESGDFGQYDFRSPYYIIAMVIHDQNESIDQNLRDLERNLSELGFPHHCVHVGPAIRQEYEYADISMDVRRKIIKRMMAFIRHTNINFHTVYIEKKHISDGVEATGKIAKGISNFIRENLNYFLCFDKVKVYYDNGQTEVTKILSSVFHVLLDNVEFRKVIPADYRLFQVADLVCSFQLIALKMQNSQLSKSELYFFGDERTIRKNYLKPLHEKQI